MILFLSMLIFFTFLPPLRNRLSTCNIAEPHIIVNKKMPSIVNISQSAASLYFLSHKISNFPGSAVEKLLSLICGLAGKIDSQLTEGVAVNLRKNNAGVRLAAL